MIPAARWRELLSEAGFSALKRQTLWGDLIFLNDEMRMVVITRYASERPEGNNYEKLIALVVKERMLA